MNDITIVFKDSCPIQVKNLSSNQFNSYYYNLAIGLKKEYGYDISVRIDYVPNSTIAYWVLKGPRQKIKRLLQTIDSENNKINKEMRLGPDLWFKDHIIFNYYNMNEFDKLSGDDLYNKYRELAYMYHDHINDAIRDIQIQETYLNSQKKKSFWNKAFGF
jgi:hypothetical protein